MPPTVSPGLPWCPILWIIFSPVCRDPGWLLPRSRQTGLRFFHVIASHIFTDFTDADGRDLARKAQPAQPGQLARLM